MTTEIKFHDDEILFLLGESGMVGIVKAGEEKMLFLETPDGEIVQYLEADDLIAVSSFYLGEKYEKGIRAMAYLTRDIEAPIIILPKDNSASKRLKLVFSVGESVRLDCGIIPGTHPEQDILCSCDSMSGLSPSSDNVFSFLKIFFSSLESVFRDRIASSTVKSM